MVTNFDFTRSGYIPSSNFNFGESEGVTYAILVGSSNNFKAVWADTNAGFGAGKFYVSSSDGLSVINLEDNSLYDAYTQTRKGRGNETLSSNDIVDINVTGG
jgi:hypothetical protein